MSVIVFRIETEWMKSQGSEPDADKKPDAQGEQESANRKPIGDWQDVVVDKNSNRSISCPQIGHDQKENDRD